MLILRSLAHVLSALMKVDETSREVIYALASTNSSADPLDDDPSQILENRLALFRKMVCPRFGSSLQSLIHYSRWPHGQRSLLGNRRKLE
jgi:hypothetical protein